MPLLNKAEQKGIMLKESSMHALADCNKPYEAVFLSTLSCSEEACRLSMSPAMHRLLQCCILGVMANVETNIQQRIRLALGTREDVRLFRNQVGQLPIPGLVDRCSLASPKAQPTSSAGRLRTITEDGRASPMQSSLALRSRHQTADLLDSSKIGCILCKPLAAIAGVARSPEDALQIISA